MVLAADGAVALDPPCRMEESIKGHGLALEDRTWSLVLHLRSAAPEVRNQAAEQFGTLVAAAGLQLARGVDSLEALPEGASLSHAVQGLLAGVKGALPVYVGAGESDEEAFKLLNKRGAITVHVGPPSRAGTAARWQVADCGEVIRLIHWLADARRRY